MTKHKRDTDTDFINVAVGDKLRFATGQELIHVLKVKGGKFEARVNGSRFNITGEVSSLVGPKGGRFVKITEDEYQQQLDAFWASGTPKGERVEAKRAP